MEGFDAGRMIGPLPLGAWVAVVSGGLGFMWYTRKRDTSAAAANADATPTPAVDVSGGVGVGASGTWTDVTPPTPGGNLAPSPLTNDDWGRAAVNYLIAAGYDPIVADSAIRKYMSGAQQSVTEYALTRQALSHIGSPPNPLPSSPFNPPAIPGPVVPAHPGPVPRPTPRPTPPRPPAAPKPARRTYTVVRGDTLSGIGARYHVAWQTIYNANHAVIGNNPNLIRPGMVLVIP